MSFSTKSRKVYRAKTPSQAKIMLFGYRSLLNQQAALMDALDEYRDRSTRATSCLEGTRVSGGNLSSPLESNAIRAVDAERELLGVLQDIGGRLQRVLQAIGSLTDELHKEILTLRYVAGYSWEEIFVKTSYEKSRAYELHGEALERVDAFLAKGQE